MTFDKVKEILANQLGIDQSKINKDSKIVADLGADSLDVVELLMALEDEFGVSVDEEKAESLVTVSDIVKLIDNSKK